MLPIKRVLPLLLVSAYWPLSFSYFSAPDSLRLFSAVFQPGMIFGCSAQLTYGMIMELLSLPKYWMPPNDYLAKFIALITTVGLIYFGLKYGRRSSIALILFMIAMSLCSLCSYFFYANFNG